MFYFLTSLYIFFVLPPMLYLLLISLAGMKKPAKKALTPVAGSISVLIPAHNEKLGIKRTIDNVSRAASRSHTIDITVIADNCSDNTADIARTVATEMDNVYVLERHNKHLRGKGAALQWAMAEQADKSYDYTMIIDADSVVNDEFFIELRAILATENVAVVQTRYEAIANEHSSIKRLAMLGFNVLRARGRVALGGSAGIMGNGFIVSKETLAKVPFRANSIVEDLEYHMRLVESDVKVIFCDTARIYGEMPTNNAASDIQSSRWEGGRLGVLKAAWLPLLMKSVRGIFSGQLHALDALLDLMLLPIGYMVFILLLGLVSPHTQLLSLFGFIVIGIYVLGAAWCGNGITELRVLKKLPSFLFRKIGRLSSLIASSSSKTNWKRTPRHKEK